MRGSQKDEFFINDFDLSESQKPFPTDMHVCHGFYQDFSPFFGWLCKRGEDRKKGLRRKKNMFV